MSIKAVMSARYGLTELVFAVMKVPWLNFSITYYESVRKPALRQKPGDESPWLIIWKPPEGG
jgi:hypothetical protein